MVGLIKTIRLLRVLLIEFDRKSRPSRGISPKIGTWLLPCVSSFLISPPKTSTCPSLMSALVLISVLLVTRSSASPLLATFSVVCSISSVMESPWLILGVTFRVIPISCRLTVENGLADVRLVLPVWKGTFWPTSKLASSLSSATIVGVDMILVLFRVLMALIAPIKFPFSR